MLFIRTIYEFTEAPAKGKLVEIQGNPDEVDAHLDELRSSTEIVMYPIMAHTVIHDLGRIYKENLTVTTKIAIVHITPRISVTETVSKISAAFMRLMEKTIYP